MSQLIGPFRQSIPTPRKIYRDDVILVLDFAGTQTGGEPFYLIDGVYYNDWRNMGNSYFERASPGISQDSSNTLQSFNTNTPRITNKGLLIEGGK